jgi:ATP-dependent Clp protease adaptor protein ClpS
MTQEKSQIVEKIAARLDLPPPKMYNVIFINDNITTMEFVIQVLVQIFGYSEDSAVSMTEIIHLQGAAVVAVLPYELAEQKAIEVTLLARSKNYPFNVKVEEAKP